MYRCVFLKAEMMLLRITIGEVRRYKSNIQMAALFQKMFYTHFIFFPNVFKDEI